CQALAEAAAGAGAEVIRGVDGVEVRPGRRPSVAFRNGTYRQLQPRLVIAADGRNSTVRAQIGIELRRTEPTHVITGMLVDGMPDWPRDCFMVGTEGDFRFLIFPQPAGRLRLYACTRPENSRRWTGPHGPRRFLET